VSNPLESWSEEQRSAFVYQALAKVEHDPVKAGLFGKLANESLTQAQFWLRELERAGKPAPRFVPDWRARIVIRMTAMLGVRAMRPVLAALKVRGLSVYNEDLAAHPRPTAQSGTEHRHRGLSGGGNLRAAVFGVNDGLVSNACLILGLAGATADTPQGSSTIVIAGVAGLLAGAAAMGAGEYVSVRTQREFYEYQIGLERDELANYPAAEAAELAIIYEAKGVPTDEARAMAERLVAQPEKALDTLAREELGLNPAELGSPWGAAIASFVSFGAGAFLPLVPYLFFTGGHSALAWVVGLTAVALFAVGASMSLFTGRTAGLAGLRMLFIGAAAGAITFGLGKLFGTVVG
jgi:VIT1/CCC1 family predicted Fe2+/Mn2+ transporter